MGNDMDTMFLYHSAYIWMTELYDGVIWNDCPMFAEIATVFSVIISNFS